MMAGGFAIGGFVAMMPIVPFQTVFAILLAILLRQSKLAAVIGTQLANPFTLPLIYFLDYQIGKWLLDAPPISIGKELFSLISLIDLGWKVALSMVLGGLILGILISVSFFFILWNRLGFYCQKQQKV